MLAGWTALIRRAVSRREVDDQRVDHPADRFVHHAALADLRKLRAHLARVAREQRNILQLGQLQQARAQPVVDVVVVVGDLVGEVGDLRLEARLALLQEALADVTQLAGVLERTVLQDAFARLEREIEAVEAAVALLELVDHAQRLQVVLESAVLLHALVQRVLPGVPERRVPEVVRQGDRLDEVFVDAELPGDRATDLRDLERMRQARAEEIAFVIDEDLGLVLEPAERAGVDHAIAVPLERRPPGRVRLGVAPAARQLRARGVGRETAAVHHRNPPASSVSRTT